ncbi:MAG: hypothetical protein M0T83_03250 [Nitrospiraceae bacterium]|nr:hypothetical protein [Nitrospiraceae bacterium]
MEMENEWEIRAMALLSRLPSGEEEAILAGGKASEVDGVQLDLAGFLAGTPMESWTAPGNEQFLGMVIRHAMVFLREDKFDTGFSPEEEVK